MAALVRRANSSGASAVLMRRGAAEAGAVFVVVDLLDGTSDLYGPAPQASFEEARPSDRKFQRIVEAGVPDAITDRLSREKRFDPDLWVVGIEDREGRSWFDTV